MAKQKAYELAYVDYKTGKTYQQIADKYKVSLAAVRAWQQRYWRKMDDIQDIQDIQNGINNSDNIQDDIQPIPIKPVVKRVGDMVQSVVAKQIADTKPESLMQYDVDYESKLTDRQRRFVREYLIDRIGSSAAIRSGYSPNDAKVIASNLLSDVNIASCIAKAEAERSKRTGLNQDLIAIELARVLRVNPINVIDMDTGEIRADATEDDLAAIQSVKVKPIIDKATGKIHYEREVRFVPKDRAMELAAKIAGMLIDRKQIDIRTAVDEMSEDEKERRIKELLAKRDAQTIDITPR